MAKIQLLFIFLQRNNGLTRQNLTHKNTSLSNAVYSIAQLQFQNSTIQAKQAFVRYTSYYFVVTVQKHPQEFRS